MENTEVVVSQKLALAAEPIEILTNLEVAPNPVTTYAEIRFSLSQGSKADLMVYDLNGRLVRQLYSGKVNADEVVQINFDRGNLMSGIYICKLYTGDGRTYERQIIIK